MQKNIRRHRVVVDLTLEERGKSEKHAVELVQRALDTSTSDIWNYEVTKYECKGFNRVWKYLAWATKR